MPIDLQEYTLDLRCHYEHTWGAASTSHAHNHGHPFKQRCWIFEYPPGRGRDYFVYATCGMTPLSHRDLLEVFILSPRKSDTLIELLTTVAHFHQTGAELGLHHTVNFGCPWLDKSPCTFGFISTPYLYGPKLEVARIAGTPVNVLWLIPITPEEREFKIAAGVSALEDLFESTSFNYLDPMRSSVV